jgi:hypothetical protein
MAHIKGMFVTKTIPLPRKPGDVTVQLPKNGNFAVHCVVPEGTGSVLVVEYGVPCPEVADVTFHVLHDNGMHSGYPSDCVYIGTYAVPVEGFLHVYGRRGLASK